MKTINKELYLEYLKDYVKLFDNIISNKIDKQSALETLKFYKDCISMNVSDFLVKDVKDNLKHFMNLSLGFATCYMLLDMIIGEYNVEQNIENFKKNAYKLKDYIECMV